MAAPQLASAGPNPDTRAADRVRVVLLTLAYLALHNLAYQFLVPTGVLAAIWPAAGLALAVLLLTPRQWRPGMLAMLAAINLAASLAAGRSLAVAAGFVVVHFCETSLGAWLLTRRARHRVTFETVGDVLSLIAVATLGNTVVGLIAAATVYLSFGDSFWQSYWTWWISNGLGVLLITPLVITWVAGWRVRRTLSWPVAAETTLFFLVWGGATWKVFHTEAAGWPFALHPYMLAPLVAWAAIRLGQRAVTGAIALQALIALGAIANGAGQSPLGGASEAERLLLLQLYLGVTAVTGLLLAASLATSRHEVRERKAGEALLRQFIRHAPAAVAMFDTEMRYTPGERSLAGRLPPRPATSSADRTTTCSRDIPDHWKAVHQRVLERGCGAPRRGSVRPCLTAPPTGCTGKIRPWRDATGAIRGVIMFTQVITERKLAEQALQESDAQRRRVEEQLRQSQKMEAIGQLAGGIAHDFNNILSVIMMLGRAAPSVHERCARRGPRVPRGDRRVGRARRELTRQLLAFSRRQVLQPRVIDLNDSVSHLARMLRRILGEDVRLALNLRAAPMVTCADPGRSTR